MHGLICFLVCFGCIVHCRRLMKASSGGFEELGESQKRECTDRMDRLATLDKQTLGEKVGHDPLFPPDLTSIAAPGTSCGDLAQNIQKSCEDFNKWQTFQAVANKKRKPFTVMGDQILFSDVSQGQLGNCYFLAALAAVAVNQPDVIENMFVETELWDNNEFKTKWLINGRMQTIVVDNMIPAKKGKAFFTQPSSTGAFWPVILAKTWAKIFGSFKAVEAGVASEAIRAMTRASYRFITLKADGITEESVWDILADGKKEKHPMVAGTCGNCDTPKKFGLASGHAYAILDVYKLTGKGNVVKMFNPWARHNFKGALEQTEELNGLDAGVFTMLVSEFFEAFSDISVSYVVPGYKASSKTIPAGELHATEVSLSEPGKFWVSLVWPSRRLVDPCPYLKPKAYVKVELSTSKGALVGKTLPRMADDNDLAVEIESGAAGVYNVLAELDYKDNSTWMSSVQLTVYGPVAAEIGERAPEPRRLALEMLGPGCKVASLPKVGLVTVDMDTNVGNGIPTYLSLDKKHFAYYYVTKDQWYVSTPEKMEEILEGNFWATFKFSKTDFTCGCHDSASGVDGFGSSIPCDRVTNRNAKYSNVKCFDSKYSSTAQKFCPETCDVCPGRSTTTTTTMVTTTTKTKRKKSQRRKTTTTTTQVKSIRPSPNVVSMPSNADQCDRISGGGDRENWSYGGTCKCMKKSNGKKTYLSRGCPRGRDFQPGRRHYSKSTLAKFTSSQLRYCKCE